MSNQTLVSIELYVSGHCAACQKARTLLQRLIKEPSMPRIDYQERPVLEYLDAAVSLGIVRTPAIVIQGKLRFTGLPKPDTLRQVILSSAQRPTLSRRSNS